MSMSTMSQARRHYLQLQLARMAGQGARGVLQRYLYSDRPPPDPRAGQQKPPKTDKKKPASKQKKEVGKLKKKVVHLQQMEDNTTGTMTYRELYSGSVISALNHHKVANYGIVNTSAYEAVLAQCRFYDPANPGVLLVGSQVAGTYTRNTLVKSVTNRLDFRNNYQTPAHVTIYHCICKDDTASTPSELWTAGIAKGSEGTGISTNSDLGQFPTDYEVVNDAWRLKVAFKGELQPGESSSVVNSVNDVRYSSSTVDQQALAFEREFKCQCYLLVVRGCLSHSAANVNEVTYQQGGIDCFGSIVFKVQYNAGMNLKYIYTNPGQSAGLTNPVCSNKPVADNQSYSAS